MVLGLQGYLVLTTYSAETSLGMLVALSLLRELGPVVAALLFAGRAGSALTAEIGLMRATEHGRYCDIFPSPCAYLLCRVLRALASSGVRFWVDKWPDRGRRQPNSDRVRGACRRLE